VETKIIHMTGIEFHKTLCHHSLSWLKKIPEKTNGYHLTRKQIRKNDYLKSIENRKIPKLTYNDFSKYFCGFDKEVEANQDDKVKEAVHFYQKNNYLLMEEVQEQSSDLSQEELLAIEENSENLEIEDETAENMYTVLKS
jgi:hypothetical protein